MSRKNNRSKYQRMISFYKKDEALRIERQNQKDERRNEKRKTIAKMPVAPVLAASSKRAMAKKETRSMTKMMKTMKVGDKLKRTLDDSSDDSDSSEQAMDVDETAAKDDLKTKVPGIMKKRKGKTRTDYATLKKNLRRKVKCGIVPDESNLDIKIAKLREEIGMND